jgi:hypothetical protein
VAWRSTIITTRRWTSASGRITLELYIHQKESEMKGDTDAQVQAGVFRTPGAKAGALNKLNRRYQPLREHLVEAFLEDVRRGGACYARTVLEAKPKRLSGWRAEYAAANLALYPHLQATILRIDELRDEYARVSLMPVLRTTQSVPL